jgi:BirA family transcriptional regulator, biotin operon repressor / biotin---[acetyl-CoA-carboxylase] ligase
VTAGWGWENLSCNLRFRFTDSKNRMYDLTALDSALAGTLFAGKLHFSPTTGSTNSDAMTAARAGAPNGSVYLADEQTAGRGRGDHGWHSRAGEGLYVSILLRLPISPARLPLLPLAAGLAAADAIRAVTGLAVDLRWPNDLLIGERKTGGILVESRNESKRLPHAVAGIGINVHQREFPPGLATPATSLVLETGVPGDRSSSLGWQTGVPGDRSSSLGWQTGPRISRQPLLVALLKSLEREACALLDSAAANAIPARVEQASTWVRGRRVVVHGPQSCTGITAGLDEDGFLRIRTADGWVTVQTGGLRAAKD